jgi:hypothetical protein
MIAAVSYRPLRCHPISPCYLNACNVTENRHRTCEVAHPQKISREFREPLAMTGWQTVLGTDPRRRPRLPVSVRPVPYQVLLSTLLVSWNSAQLRFCGVRRMGFIPRQLDYCEEILSCQTWELCVLHGGDSKRDDLRSSRPTFSNVTLRTSRSPFSSEPSSCDRDLLVYRVPGTVTDLVVVDVR